MLKIKKLLAVITAALLAIIALPSHASNFGTAGWGDALTSSISGSLQGNGDWEVTAVYTVKAGLSVTLRDSSHNQVPSPGELKFQSVAFWFCDDDSLMDPSSSLAPPSNCSNLAGGPPSFTNVASSATTLTVVFTMSPAQVAAIPSARQCLVFSTQFNDDQSTGRFFRTPGIVAPGSTGCALGVSSAQSSAPAKYSGPEFSSLSLKPVMHGSSTTLTGKRLSQVSSIEIGGKAATFTAASDTELSLTPAADLAPGTYDLVINSAAGKLTHINAVRVQTALRPFSITTRSENRITETQYYEHSLIAAMQQPELTKARCIVNGSNLAQAKAQAERLCALVRASNKNIETTVIEPRSTVKNSTVFARVTYGWN